jgi:glycosyltransferase involved in cell wall biosynthesis
MSYESIEMLYSLVIPAFNAETTIEECLVSAQTQLDGVQGVEIIVIDDGSTDATAKVAQRTLARTPAISSRVVTQRNQGVSVARNTGLDAARGKYLGFLDSDDYWLENHWATLYQRMVMPGDPDIIELNAVMVNQEDAFLSDVDVALAGDTVNDIDLALLVKYASLHKHFPWARVYRTRLFDEIRFAVDRHYEDNGAIPWIYASAKRITSIRKPMIAYRIKNEGSITGTPKFGQSLDLSYFTARAIAEAKATPALSQFWYLIAARTSTANFALIRRLPWRQKMAALRAARRPDTIPVGQADQKERLKFNFPMLYFLFLSTRPPRI